MVELTPEQQRVLGCLIEKEATTPEQYPLSMTALVLACNQATNRDPVASYDEGTVAAALTSLREQQLTRIVYPAHARVTKYRHALAEVWALTPQELAVIAVLLLRGPQTLNELRTRTERYADFADLGGIAGVVDRLAGRPEPMVVGLGRRPGQREERFAHLLAGGPDDRSPAVSVPALAGGPDDRSPAPSGPALARGPDDRSPAPSGPVPGATEAAARAGPADLSEAISELQREVAWLRDQVERLMEG